MRGSTLRDRELALERRAIMAPIAGIVGILPINAGNYVTTDSEVATIEDRSSIIVDFWVPERYVTVVKVGAPLTATPIANPGAVFEGTVSAVDNRLDEASRTLRVRADIANPDDRLRAGMSFQVSMRFPGDTYPAVNPLAVQWGSDGAFVWTDRRRQGQARAGARHPAQHRDRAGRRAAPAAANGGHRGRPERHARAAEVRIAGRERAATPKPAGPDGPWHDDAKSLETGLTALFIRRPVLAFVLNTLIAVAGLAAFYGVEIRELPDVDRAVVTVTTEFEGAAAETVDRELTDTIEGAVARVSGVKSISSTSSFGRSRVTIEFNDGVDLNVAASDVRDAVGRVANQLPEHGRGAAHRQGRRQLRRGDAARRDLAEHVRRGHDHPRRGPDRGRAGRRARRRRRPGLWRPREDLPHRRRPAQAGEPRLHRRRPAQRAGLGGFRHARRLDHHAPTRT